MTHEKDYETANAAAPALPLSLGAASDTPRTVRVEWSPHETMGDCRPGPCWGHSAVALPDNGDILVLGGTNQYLSASAQVWRFAVGARRWHLLETPRCPALSAHTASVVPGRRGRPARVVCFGGDGPVPPGALPYVLDTGTWTWSTLAVGSEHDPSPDWRRTHAAVTCREEVWIIGGATGGGFLNDAWVLDMAVSGQERWTCVDEALSESRFSRRASHSATLVANDRIFIFGGYNGRQLNDLWLIDTSLLQPTCRAVRAVGVQPPPRSGHAAVAVSSPAPCILFVGGERVTGMDFYHDMLVLDIEQLVWVAVDIAGKARWVPRGWCSASWSPTAPAEVFVFGGGSYNSFLDDLSVIDLETLEEPPRELSALGADFGSLLDSGRHADVVLEAADGGRAHAHRAILAARSPVFGAMFESDVWAEAGRGVLQLGQSEAALRALLQFIYTGCVDEQMPPAAVVEVLDLGARHLLEPLVRVCAVVLARALRRQRLGGTPEAWLVAECHRAAQGHAFTLGSCVLRREVERAAAFEKGAGYEPMVTGAGAVGGSDAPLLPGRGEPTTG